MAGMDVRAAKALAQVKFEAAQVGAPALPRLVGARGRPTRIRGTSAEERVTDGLADTPAVLVELGQAGGPNPSSVHAVESLLAPGPEPGRYGHHHRRMEDLAPFEVTILHPGRTLIDKLLRVNTFASRPADQDKIHGWAASVGSSTTSGPCSGTTTWRSLVADKQTVGDIMSSIIEVSARYTAADLIPEGGFANSAEFDPNSALATGLRREHDSAMTNLYYGDAALAPSFDDVIGRVRDSAALLDL